MTDTATKAAMAAFTAKLFSDMLDHAGTVGPGSASIEWAGDEGNLHWHVGRAFALMSPSERAALAGRGGASVTKNQEENDMTDTTLGAPKDDAVNHPKHYTSHPSGIECIQITRWMSANCANAFKYLWRAGLKGAALQDLQKARWYLQDAIDHGTEQPGPVARAALMALDWKSILIAFPSPTIRVLHNIRNADVGGAVLREEHLREALNELDGVIAETQATA